MADERIVTEPSALRLQVQGLAEQRKADKAKEETEQEVPKDKEKVPEKNNKLSNVGA